MKPFILQPYIVYLKSVPEGRVFGLDQQTLISTGIQLLNVIILAVLLGYLLYKPVRSFLQKRKEKISGQFDEARKTQAQADQLKAEYEKKRKEIDQERTKVLEEARLSAEEDSRKILDASKKDADAIRQQAEKSIAMERKDLDKETRQYIIEAAVLMAEKFIEQSMNRDTQNKLFDEAVAQLEETPWVN
ncbi:ATP synthase F0 subunit B [Eubacteriales bacterium mix99]